MKNNILIVSSIRKAKDIIDQFADGFLPKIFTISEFFSNIIYSELLMSDEITRTIFMQQAVAMTKNSQKLSISANFFEFLKNKDYLFSFFKELVVSQKTILDIQNSDVYADYNEHLQILEDVFNNYKNLLKTKGLCDEITIYDEYYINYEFLKNCEKITIYMDGILSNIEIDILKKISNFCNILIKFKSNFVVEKMFNNAFGINVCLNEFCEYEFDLNSKKIYKINDKKQPNTDIVVRGFGARYMQGFFVFEKISEFINCNIEAKNIVVILPDESFAPILRSLDKNNMLNFAMGSKIGDNIFYIVLSKLIENIESGIDLSFGDDFVQKNCTTSDEILLNYCGINGDLFQRLRHIYLDEGLRFKQLKDIVFEILSLLDMDKISNQISKIFFEIEGVLNRLNLNTWEILKVFLINLKEAKIDHIGGGSIVVMGLLESRGLKFDGVIIVDFDDENVPKRDINDIFLNSYIRQKAGLISKRDREGLQKFYYKNLINNAKKVAISFEESESKIRSRFLKDFQTITCSKYSDNDYLNMFSDIHIVKKNPSSMLIKHDFFANELSFTRLNTFLKSPKEYAFKYIFKLKPPRSVDSLNPYSIGQILHNALELSYKEQLKAKDKSYVRFDPKLCKDIFLNLIKNQPFNPIEIGIYMKKIDLIEATIFEHEQSGYRVDMLEAEFSNVFCGIKIHGKIDRIDRLNDEIMLIDYKSGFIDLKSFQLAFYKALLIGDGDKYKNESVKSKFLSLKDYKFQASDKDIFELKTVIEQLKDKFKHEFDFSQVNGFKFDNKTGKLVEDNSSIYYSDFEVLSKWY